MVSDRLKMWLCVLFGTFVGVQGYFWLPWNQQFYPQTGFGKQNMYDASVPTVESESPDYSHCMTDLISTVEKTSDISWDDLGLCLSWVDYCKSVARCWNKNPPDDCFHLKTHLGQFFVLTFISNSNTLRSPTLLIATKDTAQVTITIPYINMAETHTVNKYAEIDLPVEIIPSKFDGPKKVYNVGVEVVSDVPIAVYTLNSYNQSADGTVILPVDLLSNEYIIDAYNDSTSDTREIAVTAFKDNTDVRVQLPYGDTVTAALKRLDVLAVRFPALSGTVILSTEPINVQAGHHCANLPTDDAKYCDLVSTEVIPAKNLYKTYIVPYMYPREDFSVSITVRYDDTTVMIGNTNGETIDSFEGQSQRTFVKHFTNEPAISITASKPVLVSQYGHGASGSSGDPSLTTIPPPQLYTNCYPFFVSGRYNPSNVVSIIIYSPYDSTGLRLDGQPLNPVETQTINLVCGGKFEILYIEVSSGYHVLTHGNMGAKFGAVLYSRATRMEYTTFLGLEVDSVDNELQTTLSSVVDTARP